jgi:hypothetical protein
MVNPDFMKLASSMNVHGIRVTSKEELPAKMKEFLEYPNDKPVLIECLVTKTEHVFPMVCCLMYVLKLHLLTLTSEGPCRKGPPRTDAPPQP